VQVLGEPGVVLQVPALHGIQFIVCLEARKREVAHRLEQRDSGVPQLVLWGEHQTDVDEVRHQVQHVPVVARVACDGGDRRQVGTAGEDPQMPEEDLLGLGSKR
jgi:hypothetical protein